MPINIAPSSSVRPTGNHSEGGACIAVVLARCGILPAMRRVWLALWALWLALAPIGSAWAYACACTGQPVLACCVRSTPCCKTPPAVRGEPRGCYSCPTARETLCAAGKVDDGLPPSTRFPPLTRGEPSGARVRFPLPAGGTLRRGLDSEATPLREGKRHLVPPACVGSLEVAKPTEKTPCSKNNCQGCSLERAKPAPASASVSRPALEWADCVLDAPALRGLIRVEPVRACFGLPVVRNHSPPLEPSAPRAPPLCCVC